MCLQPTSVRSIQKYRWSGDEIVHDPVIPASRTVPGTKTRRYPIDIREYLTTDSNAVIRSHLSQLIARLSVEDKARFTSHAAGSFDFRARAVTAYVGEKLSYQPSGRDFDEWRFPDETLAAGGGDCEDLAFVLAALLEASGISGYCLRVALGTFGQQTTRLHAGSAKSGGKPKIEVLPQKRSDHAWVVYLNERGAWEILEPLAIVASEPAKANKARGRKSTARAGASNTLETVDAEYLPHFVFNRQHLWRVRSDEDRALQALPDYLSERTFWSGFNPSYATSIHNSIYDEALRGMSGWDLASVKRVSLGVDANVLAYDPRDHFDFAYIPEGWKRVERRLASKNLTDFGLAVHAIADFYAHTLYGEFAPRRANGSIAPYNPARGVDGALLGYDFSKYAPIPGANDTPANCAQQWSGTLISGQWWRWFTTFPSELKNAAGFPRRRNLPDHDAIAVDSASPGGAHRRYDPAEYAWQFALRRGAAVEHIRSAYQAWRA
jgi:hypothetical protein